MFNSATRAFEFLQFDNPADIASVSARAVKLAQETGGIVVAAGGDGTINAVAGAVLRPQDEHDRLRGWEPAVRAWAAAGADIVMGGHIHLPYVCELSASVHDLSRRMWCVQAGTAVSSRIRREAPNAVNLLEFEVATDGLRCCVERWDYQKAGNKFEPIHTSVLNLQRQSFEQHI